MGYGGQPYTGMGQQPAYGMGTGGQYSPQLRQAQTAWQNQYTPAAETQGGQQPYGMGAQGNGNAYGYGGQQGNPWAQLLGMMGGQQQPQYGITAAGQQYGLGQAGTYNTPMNTMQTQGSTSLAPPAAPPADWNGQAGYDFRHNPATNPNIRPQALAAAQASMQAPPPMPTSFSGINNLPRGAYQIPGYGGTPSAAPPPQAAAAPTRAQYSPNNPFGGLYSNPQADAWEQQQRGGGAPAAAAPVPATPSPAAPGTDVMRKALAAGSGANQGTTNGYGYGTPGGYQLDTAPSTLDPGSMNALLGIMGGNINGVGYPTSAANYANWYQQTYGTQAPGGAPRAYPF
jgi:hypothetical protein